MLYSFLLNYSVEVHFSLFISLHETAGHEKYIALFTCTKTVFMNN
jgi:hypothetical protein